MHRKVLAAAAWAVTAGAAVMAVVSTVTGKGGMVCIFLMTIAIVLQSAYAKEYKQNRDVGEKRSPTLSEYRKKKP